MTRVPGLTLDFPPDMNWAARYDCAVACDRVTVVFGRQQEQLPDARRCEKCGREMLQGGKWNRQDCERIDVLGQAVLSAWRLAFTPRRGHLQ